MIKVVKLIEHIESEEGQKKMDEYLEKIAEYQNKVENNIKVLFDNDDYINWLISFIKANGIFFDDDYTYSENVSYSNLENINKLCFFFQGIENYAEEKNIDYIPIYYGYYYQIKHNGNGLQIGVINGEGTHYFANLVQPKKDFIDYSKIKVKKIKKTKFNVVFKDHKNEEHIEVSDLVKRIKKK